MFLYLVDPVLVQQYFFMRAFGQRLLFSHVIAVDNRIPDSIGTTTGHVQYSTFPFQYYRQYLYYNYYTKNYILYYNKLSFPTFVLLIRRRKQIMFTRGAASILSRTQFASVGRAPLRQFSVSIESFYQSDEKKPTDTIPDQIFCLLTLHVSKMFYLYII